MSLDQLMAALLLIYAVALAITIATGIIGASLYDLRATKQQRRLKAHPHSGRYRQRPLITVVIVAQNSGPSLKACLDALRRSSYRKLQILIIDNASTDNTKAETQNYLSAHPKLNARLIVKRKSTQTSVAAHKAYQTYGKGELVMIMNADDIVERQALRRAVNHFNDESDIEVLAPRLQPLPASSLRGLWQTYMALLSHRSNKTADVMKSSHDFSSTGLFCRREALSKILRTNASNSVSYAHDIIIHQPEGGTDNKLASIPSDKQTKRTAWPKALLTASAGLSTLLTPILVTYFIYLAVGLKEPLFLLLAMAGLAIFLVFAVWEDEQLRLRQRLAYTIGIPITYSMFYITSWIRLISTFRSVFSNA